VRAGVGRRPLARLPRRSLRAPTLMLDRIHGNDGTNLTRRPVHAETVVKPHLDRLRGGDVRTLYFFTKRVIISFLSYDRYMTGKIGKLFFS